ncbi:MAG: response regulator transcription factor [Acidaminococcaceae bacterium]
MITDKPVILIVEDEVAIRNLIATTLSLQNYKSYEAGTGVAALSCILEKKPDIVLLDLGLPDMDGGAIITKVRTWSQIPIIVLSARSDDSDKIAALDAGADDYLTKPFSVEELLARLRSTIRRLQYLQAKGDTEEVVFRNGALAVDYSAATVTLGGAVVHLMPIEYSLLCLLAKNVGKVLTHHYILDKVWVNAIESDLSSLRVYMASLRKKLEVPGGSKYIQTHIGLGYRMVKVDAPQ